MAKEATTELDKNGKPKRPPIGPRAAYILLTEPLPEGVEVVDVSRKAEHALEAIDTGRAKAYIRIMVK